MPFRRPVRHTLIGHFNGRVLRDTSHLPELSLPVDLWIIGVGQLMRRQIGYTFLGSAVLVAGRCLRVKRRCPSAMEALMIMYHPARWLG
jgi:hypothetical protein